jgi:hypothetical protein
MAKKIELIEKSLVITDTVLAKIVAEFPSKDIYFDTQELEKVTPVVKFYDTNGTNEQSSGVFQAPLADCIDVDLVAFTASTFRDFCRVSLGFSVAPGGPGWGKTLTPEAFTSDVNDYAPTGFDNSIAMLRVDPGANNREITGLGSKGFRNGQSLFVVNISSIRRITLPSNDEASAPENRFVSKGTTTLDNEEGILIVYDGTSKRWRLDKAN